MYEIALIVILFSVSIACAIYAERLYRKYVSKKSKEIMERLKEFL